MIIQLTINDYEYYDSEEYDAESDPSRDSNVATYATNGNSQQKLLTNREIPAIIQGVIPLVNQTTADGVATSRRALNAVRMVINEEIVMGTTRSTAGVLKDHPVINWKDTSSPISVDKNTVGIPPRTTTQVLTGTGPSASLISIGIQNIESPRWSIIP